MAEARISSMLLERGREIALLDHAWRAAVAGQGSLWLLCAEAGGGKTRLAAEVAAGIGSRRTRWGAAEPVSPPDPFLAVRRALPEFEPASVRTASVENAVALLRAAQGPTLLVLDDLHYADEGTVAVLVRLGAECAAQPWLVLATFRPGEGTASLRESAVEMVAQGTGRRLDLPPLSPEAVAALVSDIRRRPVDPVEAAAIHGDSGGNPWFAEALARGNGAVNAARDRISLRLDRLEQAHPGALAVLKSLAPASRPLPHAVVAAVCGGDTPDLRRSLVRLRDAGLLREDGEGWGFRHELLRRSLFDEMIGPDRRDAHRAMAEALAGHGSAAETAMHFAEADDPRAAEWALRAGREARAVDAHVEALAQFRRALRCDLPPEQRRLVLREAAREAFDLALHDQIMALVGEALAIPGGAPEDLATLHQLAARSARARGDNAADDAHLAAAERLLEGRPPSQQMTSIVVARIARAVLDVRPERLEPLAAKALRLAEGLGDAVTAAMVEAQVKAFLAVSQIDRGDPGGFNMLEEVVRLVEAQGMAAGIAVSAQVNAYEEAVLSLFHAEAEALRGRVLAAIERHGLGWQAMIAPYRALELMQHGRYDEVRAYTQSLTAPEPGTLEQFILLCVSVLREARAGSPERAQMLLAASNPIDDFQATALTDLARLEVAMLIDHPGLGELAQGVYATMNRRRYARIAGVAVLALARSGRGAVPPPAWLPADAPPRLFWEWAAALEHRDAPRLRAVSARLTAMQCPFEAAIALRDAGDLGAAYRGLRAIGAGQVREQIAESLRTAGRPIPRRTRAAAAVAGLTETERAVCRLVAAGHSNEGIAAALGISGRTVATHLTRIYAKTGCHGRTALALWWTQQRSASVP